MANEGVDNQSSWTGGKTSPESNIATKWKKMTWKLLCTIKIVEKIKEGLRKQKPNNY